MIKLRPFSREDAPLLKELIYPDLTIPEIEQLISSWNTKEYRGRYFEMFGAIHDNRIVGTISLFALSAHSISCGPDILPQYRKHGFGRKAMLNAMEIAKGKGYQISVSQIAVNNKASIALHQSLGFESSGYVYKNQKDNDVLIYFKSLVP